MKLVIQIHRDDIHTYIRTNVHTYIRKKRRGRVLRIDEGQKGRREGQGRGGGRSGRAITLFGGGMGKRKSATTMMYSSALVRSTVVPDRTVRTGCEQ